MNCPHCAKAIDPGARFCPNCGAAIGERPRHTGVGEQAARPAPRPSPAQSYPSRSDAHQSPGIPDTSPPTAADNAPQLTAFEELPEGVDGHMDIDNNQQLMLFHVKPIFFLNWLVLGPLVGLVAFLVPYLYLRDYNSSLVPFRQMDTVVSAKAGVSQTPAPASDGDEAAPSPPTVSEAEPPWWTMLVPLCYWPGILIALYAVFWRGLWAMLHLSLSKSYRITSQYVEIRYSLFRLFSYRRDTISFHHIRDVDDRAVLLQRLFHTGRIELSVSDPNYIKQYYGGPKGNVAGGEFTPDVVTVDMLGVPDVHRVTNLLRTIMTAYQHRYTIRHH